MRGRALGSVDDERSAKTAAVNETLASRYWPDRGALGLVGLPLATVGLYGIIAYSAGRRPPAAGRARSACASR